MKPPKRKLLNDEKNYIANIKEITGETSEKITFYVKAGVQIKEIWNLLDSETKANEKIHTLFLNLADEKNVAQIKMCLMKVGKSEEEIFAHIQQNNPKLIRYCIKKYKISTDTLIMLIKNDNSLASELTSKVAYMEIIEVCPETVEFLPKELIQQEDISKKIDIEKSSLWMRDGEAIQFFSLGKDIKFGGREDYLKIVQVYIKEDLSIPQFCERFHIKNVNGFSEVLNKFETEDEKLKEEIQTVKEHAKKRYIESMKDLVGDIINGKTTISESIGARPRLTCYDFLDAKDYLDEEKYTKLLQIIVNDIGLDYRKNYKTKNLTETDKNGVSYMLIGKQSIETLIRWFSYDESKNPAKNVGKAINKITGQALYNPRVNVNSDREFFKGRCKRFETIVNPKEYTESVSYMIDGKEIRPTEENVQYAMQYLEATDRYLCKSNFDAVLKAIAKGKLTIEAIESAKSEKSEQIKNQQILDSANIEKIASARNIDEYIECCTKEKSINRNNKVQQEHKENNQNVYTESTKNTDSLDNYSKEEIEDMKQKMQEAIQQLQQEKENELQRQKEEQERQEKEALKAEIMELLQKQEALKAEIKSIKQSEINASKHLVDNPAEDPIGDGRG